jgi:hypothetical protein
LILLGGIGTGIFFLVRWRRKQNKQGILDRPSKEGDVQAYPITPASRNGFLLDPMAMAAVAADARSGHTYSTSDGLYSPLPQSPASTARESWRDSQQQVTMSVQRNQKNLGNTVTPSIADDSRKGSPPPPTFTEATQQSQIIPPGKGKE